jgi:hypothetical protein
MPVQTAHFVAENAFQHHLKINNILSAIVDETLNETKPFFTEVFNVPEIVPKAAVDDLTLVGFDVLNQKNEADDITFDRAFQGYQTRYLNVGYGSGYGLSHEYQINEQYGIAERLTRMLASAAMRSADILAANIFNSGGSLNSTFLSGGDAVALFSQSHPVKGSTDTLSNDAANAADISVVALQEQINTFQKQEGDRGELLDHDARVILVPTEAQWDAREIVKSTDRPDTAERATNVLNDLNLMIKVWKRLTDADTWFILDEMSKHQLKFRWRERPNAEGWIERRSLNFLYRIFMMLSIGHSDWRGVRRIQGA